MFVKNPKPHSASLDLFFRKKLISVESIHKGWGGVNFVVKKKRIIKTNAGGVKILIKIWLNYLIF